MLYTAIGGVCNSKDLIAVQEFTVAVARWCDFEATARPAADQLVLLGTVADPKPYHAATFEHIGKQ